MSRADESRAGEIATAIILSPVIATITVALRMYIRRVLIGVRFFEDYCIVGAMICSLTMSGFMGTCKLQVPSRPFLEVEAGSHPTVFVFVSVCHTLF
jgi:hypothetical protein